MTLRIEFCGVPASGKSSLSSETVRLLKKRGHEILDRKEAVHSGLGKRNFGLLGGFLGAFVPGWRREFLGVPHSLNDWHDFVVKNPEFTALIHNWLAHAKTDTTWRSCVFYTLLTTAFEFRMSQMAGKPVLLDESFAQRFFTLRGYYGLGQTGDAARYAATMPLPTILISVSASPEICLSRLKMRSQLPLLMQDEPEELLLKRIGEGAQILGDLATEMEHRGVFVLRVLGEKDPIVIIEKITEYIERHITR